MCCALLCCCMWKLWLFGLSKFSVLNIMCQNSTVTVNTYSCLIKPENYNNKKTTKVDCKVYHAFLFQLFFFADLTTKHSFSRRKYMYSVHD